MRTRCKKSKWQWGSYLSIGMAIFMATTAVHASSEKPIKIGVLCPIKLLVGEHISTGAKIAADEINASGGVSVGNEKRRIEIVVKDTNEGWSTTEAPGSIERAINIDKADFLIGGYNTEAVMAMQEVMADYKKILISNAMAPILSERVAKNYDRYKYWFRMSPNIFFYTRAVTYGLSTILDKIRMELGIKTPKVALLLAKSKVSEPIPGFVKPLEPKLGFETVGVWWPANNATDMSVELAAIRSSGAHVIYTFLPATSGSPFSKQWGELKIPAAPIGYNEQMTERQWKLTGGLCEFEASVYTVARDMEITPRTQPFVKRFIEKVGETPLYQAVGSYDAVYTIKEAVERAGTVETEAVLRELEKTDRVGAQGRIAYFPKGDKWPHDVISGPGYVPFVCVQWQAGQLKGFWPDGRATHDEKKWEGVKYRGTAEYKLPPWMKSYWSPKK